MAKSKKLDRRSDTKSCHHGIGLHKLSSRCTKICGDAHYAASQVKASRKNEWEDAVCSVCMEIPHNAVLLLCSSFDKGCRPFMCATSHRFSNCLQQYKKAYTKASQNQITTNDAELIELEGTSCPNGKNEASELLCPLCRCPVKGWTAVEPARKYLNAKKRACIQDKCSFVGSYRELRKHVKVEHPLACPRAVDPSHAAKWKRLENERDMRDVFSTIRSTMPGAIIIGDYVIERYDRDEGFFQFPSYEERWNGNGPGLSSRLFGEDEGSVLNEDFHRPLASSSRRLGDDVHHHRARYCISRRAARLRRGR